MTYSQGVDWLPVGYRLIWIDDEGAIECERGCGWKLNVETISHLPTDARERLFRNHDAWHRLAS